MADPHNSQRIEVTEIAETVSVVEITVPIALYAQPELTLFRTIIGYLEAGPRRAVTGITIVYEIRSHNAPHLVATLFLTEPI